MRKDDDPEVLPRRLVAYRNETAPLTSYYSLQGALRAVDGMAPIDEVTAAIERAIAEALAARNAPKSAPRAAKEARKVAIKPPAKKDDKPGKGAAKKPSARTRRQPSKAAPIGKKSKKKLVVARSPTRKAAKTAKRSAGKPKGSRR